MSRAPAASVSPRARTRAAGLACGLGGFLLAAIFLAPSLTGRQAFVPADYWLGSVPFAFAQPPGWRSFESNTLLGDPACLYPPQLWALREGIDAGAFPLWNRFARGGETTLGSGQTGPLAPTTWPILLLPWPLGFAWAALLRFGLLWSGAYLFGRSLGLARAGSVAVAVGFCCAPLFAVHFQQLPRATAHVALPWLLFVAERFARASGRGTRAVVRAALPFAPIAAFSLLAGYPPAALTVLTGAALYVAIRVPWRPLGRAVALRALAAASLAIGAALAAPALLPFAAALADSATLADRSDGGQWTLPARALRMLWDPFAFGSPMASAAHAWNGPDNFEEAQQYVGVLPWLLLLAALPALPRLRRTDRSRALALGATIVFSASLAFGWWPLHPLVTRIPPFDVNANPRLLFLAQTAIGALAVLAIGARLRERAPAPSRGFAPCVASAIVAGIALFGTAAAEAWALRPWIAAGAGLAGVAALLLASTPRERRIAAALVPALWLADVGPVYAGLHRPVPRDWADPARAVAALPEPLRRDPAPRVAFERFTPPNLPALFGVEDVRAYSFPSPMRYDRFALEVMGVEIPMNLLRDDLAKPGVIAGLERTCAQWLWTTQRYDGTPIAARVERVWQRSDRIFVYRLLRASPCAAWHPGDGVTRVADLDAAVARLRASLDATTEEIVVESASVAAEAATRAAPPIATPLRWSGPNRIELDVPPTNPASDGWLVVRVSHDRGWSARSERGTALRVVPAQVRFLAVEVPAGTEHVTLSYGPPGWGIAWSVTGAAGGIWLLGVALTRRATADV